ncbi:hypothetical protein JR316_0008368 [Psilocybe cubensis]|uniref:Uncharacterized protein n=2 Tax=Psilocybe cubensis TaxID=181762 RepID=A0ACB8GVK7_PSICU|nr:hypothetical protein JR316_0008365 [Psilocybe cubensis]XP_047747398.1 hypothetical protein JR316_0008368 [Psilocybe cubensis]KAH9479770.1 hypothetical protein JR316_0008365 [Psilocybe cubensis]KAH9479773.1 hypothetical protein JR316_0008368 [Psilocybe cubensis]
MGPTKTLHSFGRGEDETQLVIAEMLLTVASKLPRPTATLTTPLYSFGPTVRAWV